jgi:hypothetical protein
MENPKPLTTSEGEVRELTEEDFQRGMNFSELPKNLQVQVKENRSSFIPSNSPSTHR